jgi:CubicO group peptidase (beta-lactamase class C family)
MRPAPLESAVESLRAQVARGAFPGAALAVGRGERIALETEIGTVAREGTQVDAGNTIYDLASLTKAVATTTAVMLLTEDGRMELDAPVARYLPEFSGGDKDRVTIRHLLTHTSGLPAWADLWSSSPRGSLARAIRTPLERAPGARAEYSDIGFVVLWAAAERAAGEPLPELLEQRVWRPLGMERTRFAPGEGCGACAPTLRLADGTTLRGVVHDPIARRLNGVTGNAGLFATVHDLARFAAMLANGGELAGVRLLRAETVADFTRRQPGLAAVRSGGTHGAPMPATPSRPECRTGRSATWATPAPRSGWTRKPGDGRCCSPTAPLIRGGATGSPRHGDRGRCRGGAGGVICRNRLSG